MAKPIPEGCHTLTTYLAVDDAAGAIDYYTRAVDAGATVTMEVADQFWGDRFGTVTDQFGHVWSLATHVEDVPPEEMAERAKAAMAGAGSS